MFGCIRAIFLTAMKYFGCNILNENPLNYVSVNNQKYRTRPQAININSNEGSFYPFII